MTKNKKLEAQFAAHDAAAKQAISQGKTAKQAVISGLAAELMFCISSRH